jgi:hypothetical protein
MSTISTLITKYGPAVAPAVLVLYLVLTRQWEQLPAAVTALLAALGITAQVTAARVSAEAAADQARAAAGTSLAMADHVRRLAAAQAGAPR